MRAPAGSLLDQTARLVVRRQIRYGERAPRAVGHLRVGVQRARPRPHLPVLELRRRPAWASSAGSPRTSSSLPTRPPWRRWSSRARRRATSSGSPQLGAMRPRTGSTRRSTTRRRGFPRGERFAIVRAYMAHHQGMTIVALANVLDDGPDAGPLPRRAGGPGDRAAAPGAHAARRRRRAPAGRGGPGASRGPRRRAPGPAALPLPARPDAAHAPAVERPLRGHAHGRRLGLQPLAGPGRHALARGRHARRVGQLRLPARRAQRPVWSAGYQPTGAEPDTYEVDLRRGPRRDPPSRRLDRDDPRGRRLARGRRRGAPGLGHQPRDRARGRSS